MAANIENATPEKRKKLRSFEEKEIEAMISEWIKYPCLYEKADADYHNKDKRGIARKQIAEFLNSSFEYTESSEKFITAFDVQKKLENLRTYFGKEYGKEKESKPRSGSSAKKPFRSSWPFYNSLAFLSDHIVGPRDTVSNLPEITIDEDDSEDSRKKENEIPKFMSTPSVKKTSGKKLSAEESLIKVAEQIVEKIPSASTSSPKKQKLTDDDHFGQTISRQLAKLNEGEAKESLKIQIQIMIHQALYGQHPQGQYSASYQAFPFSKN